MKLEFIKRGAESRLILIYSGWSTTPEFYRGLAFDGWDTAVVHDYGDEKDIEVPRQYKTVYLFAYSLGVWAADMTDIPATIRVAVAGTPVPVSDEFGIPESIYSGTEKNLDKRNLMKFHRRMAGDKETYQRISGLLPESPDIELLREELAYIRLHPNLEAMDIMRPSQRWDRAYVPESDSIIPTANQLGWWRTQDDTETVLIPGGHAANLHKVISTLLPDHKSIGTGFKKSLPDYKDNATVQREVADKIAAILADHLTRHKVRSLLEIGAGPGLLTERWRKLVRPDRATYIDLYKPDVFGTAEEERYVVADAERWMEGNQEKYDVILSASAIQWFADPIRFLREIRSHLNDGGTAIISTFLKGNLHELDAVRPSPIIYRSKEEYEAVADGIEAWTRVLGFGSAREALMHLKRTGVSGSASGAKSLSHILKSLSAACLTYRPAMIIIRND